MGVYTSVKLLIVTIAAMSLFCVVEAGIEDRAKAHIGRIRDSGIYKRASGMLASRDQHARRGAIDKRQAYDEEENEDTPPPPPPTNKTIFFNFDRHDRKTFVRFILADTVKLPGRISSPVVIDSKECPTYGDMGKPENLPKFKPLQTFGLNSKVDDARNCQSYFVQDAAPPDWFPIVNGTRFGWPVVVTAPTEPISKVGWNASKAVEPPEGSKNLWSAPIDPSSTGSPLYLDCDKWWHQSEIHWFTPQFYARQCQLKVLNGKQSSNGEPLFTCIASNGLDFAQLVKEGKDLVYEDCDRKRKRKNQIWHIQSVAYERGSAYYPDGGLLHKDFKDARHIFDCSHAKLCDN